MHFWVLVHPPKINNMSSKKVPFQKESRLPTTIFLGDMLIFWGVTFHRRTVKPPFVFSSFRPHPPSTCFRNELVAVRLCYKQLGLINLPVFVVDLSIVTTSLVERQTLRRRRAGEWSGLLCALRSARQFLGVAHFQGGKKREFKHKGTEQTS